MNKKSFSLIISLACAVSCMDTIEESGSETEYGTGVFAEGPDFVVEWTDTRTTLHQDGNSAPIFSWKEGDIIGIIPMGGKTVQSNYEVKELGQDPKTAHFDGGDWSLKEGKTYSAYYPFIKEAVQSGETLTFSFDGQRQAKNNDMSHLGQYDFMYANATCASNGTATFQFKHLVSLIRLQLSVPKGQYTRVQIEGQEAWFASKAVLSLSNGSFKAPSPYLQKVATVNLGDISLESPATLTIWISVLPTASLKGKNVNINLYSSTGCLSGSITVPSIWEAGKAYSFAADLSTEPTEPHTLSMLVTGKSFTVPSFTGGNVSGNVSWGDGSSTPYSLSLNHTYNSGTKHHVVLKVQNEDGFVIQMKGVQEVDLSEYFK